MGNVCNNARVPLVKAQFLHQMLDMRVTPCEIISSGP
jgi:hypothetical protein